MNPLTWHDIRQNFMAKFKYNFRKTVIRKNLILWGAPSDMNLTKYDIYIQGES